MFNLFKKIPSVKISNTTQELKNVIFRFPLLVIISLLGTASAVILSQHYLIKYFSDEKILINFIMGGIMSFFLVLSTYLILEKFKLKKIYWWLSSLVIAVLPFVYNYFFSLTDDTVLNYLRYVSLFIAIIVLLFITPYFHKRNLLTIWCFNYQIIVKLILTCVFTGILLAGLMAAVFGIDTLISNQYSNKFFEYII